MSDSDVLDYLREQFARIDSSFDRILSEPTNEMVRPIDLEAECKHLRAGLADVNGRLDHLETRVNQIERRLDLVDAR